MSEYLEDFDFNEAISDEEIVEMAARTPQLQSVLRFIFTKEFLSGTTENTTQTIKKDAEAYLHSVLTKICHLYELDEDQVLDAAIRIFEERLAVFG